MSKLRRIGYIISGRVQGVGFRPFVWRLARSGNLTGSVANTSAGVRMELQGKPENLAAFERRLLAELPPLAVLTGLEREELEEKSDETAFSIMASRSETLRSALPGPDAAVCEKCLAEMRDPADRRHDHPFISCVDCGPRFTITRFLPYDRPATSMACFPLCEKCAAEYADPATRRFHAQPVACPECGPKLWFLGKGEALSGKTKASPENSRHALEKACRLILSGGILALKGLGGFQLACDARDSKAVASLRARKNRPHKALAVMTADIEAARIFCSPSREQEKIMSGIERPITLCPIRHDSPAPLSALIAPDCESTGLMLPSTPLHALLFDRLAEMGLANPVLVMTSGNAAGEPICLSNREALAKLKDLADGWLLHDRDILCRLDDSVALTIPLAAAPAEIPCIVRRARGFVPVPINLPPGQDLSGSLGVGAELKAAFCLGRGTEAFLGQHTGDLKSPASLDFYRQALRHLRNLLESEITCITRDLHPDFLSSQLAEALGAELNVPVFCLQHHAAHAASALGENGLAGPALALCLDGAGLGDNGEIWGGELIYMDLSGPCWRRLGGLSPFPLPGGDAAAQEPWRLARALGQKNSPVPEMAAAAVDEMLARGLNCPPTSSAGRLFDAFSSLLGLCHKITYEGQAPILLESAAAAWLAANAPRKAAKMEVELKEIGGLARLDSRALFAQGQEMLASGLAPGEIAWAFHRALSRGLAGLCKVQAASLQLKHVALTGGAMQNRLLASMLAKDLREAALEPVWQRQAPPGDGGLALGQMLWGARLEMKGR